MTTALGTSHRAAAPWQAAGAVVAGALADVAFDPAHRHVPLCPFHSLTGWDCPLCGGLRSVNAALRGQLTAAWQANVLLWCAVPLLAVWWLTWLRRGTPPRLGRSGVFVLVAVLMIFTVVRNLPFATALRPA